MPNEAYNAITKAVRCDCKGPLGSVIGSIYHSLTTLCYDHCRSFKAERDMFYSIQILIHNLYTFTYITHIRALHVHTEFGLI